MPAGSAAPHLTIRSAEGWRGISLRSGFFVEMGLAISSGWPGIHYVHYGNCPVSGLQHAQVLKSVCLSFLLSLPPVLLPFPLETGSHSIVLTGLEFADRQAGINLQCTSCLCWEYRCVPPVLAYSFLSKKMYFFLLSKMFIKTMNGI